LASKDQAIGGLIFIVCIIIAIGYLLVLVAPGTFSPIIGINPFTLQFWAIAIVVLIAFLAIMFIGAWIGWTMATTPPPKPIEELETEEEKTEAKTEPAEETKTQEKTDPAVETGSNEPKKRRRK